MGSEGGSYLAGLRARRGLALDQVVHALGARYQIRISRSALSRYETGARAHPDAMLLWGLAQIYAEPLAQIIVASRGRRDLIRHNPPAGCTDDDSAHARNIKLAERLERAIGAAADVALALRGEDRATRAAAPARGRAHRQAS